MNTKNIKQHLPLIFAISYADHRLVVNPPPVTNFMLPDMVVHFKSKLILAPN